jgi:hypothetical protein
MPKKKIPVDREKTELLKLVSNGAPGRRLGTKNNCRVNIGQRAWRIRRNMQATASYPCGRRHANVAE